MTSDPYVEGLLERLQLQALHQYIPPEMAWEAADALLSLRAQMEEMAGALGPFANVIVTADGADITEIGVGDFVRARQALAAHNKGTE